MKQTKRYISCLFLALVCGFSHAEHTTITVAVAANFSPVLQTLATEFEDDAGSKVTIVVGSSGKLYAQIINGAPFDIFMSADTSKPKALINAKKVTPDTYQIYALGRLVVASSKPLSKEHIQQRFISGKFRRLAIANPKHAPYGIAAASALQNYDISGTYKENIVYGQNVLQTLQYAHHGVVDAAIVAKSLSSKLSHWEIPKENHPPIEQAMVLLKHAEDNPTAQAFMRFLQRPASKAIIQNAGYLTP